jgi:predicted porin
LFIRKIAMRPLLYSLLVVFASPYAFAQGDVSDQVAALQKLIEDQSRLLKDQSAQLASLTQRVSELEGRSGDSQATSGGLVALENEPVSPQDGPQTARRTDAIEAGEIGLEQKKSLRTGKESVIVEDAVALSETMDLYGSMRIFSEIGAEDPTLNDGSSRLGIRLGRDLPQGRTLFGRIEWKTNLVDNDSELFQGDASSGGGIAVRSEDTEKVLSTRLGYLGMRFEDIGELSFGKQWSVYYDVAGWTDNFNVYGGAGLSVYAAGTDGGAVGSGRADNAVVWRNERGRFSYGLQTQLKTSSDDDDYKGLGGSMIFAPNDTWDIGFAFAAARIKGGFELIAGDKDSNVATLGARYHRGPWNAAFSVAKWDNHEGIFFEDDTLIYDGVGAELYTSYEYSDRLHLYGGFNYTDPDIDDPRVDPDFGVEFLILGASWFATKDSFAYLEGLLSSSKDVNGKHVDSVLSAGYRFDF